jgi:hypothetical protein
VFFLGVPLVGSIFLLQLATFPSRWGRPRWRSGLPLVACVLVFPGIWTVGPRLLVARFYWHRSEYERIARAIESGKHPESLGSDEQKVAHWVKVTRLSELGEEVPMFLPGTSTLRPDRLSVVGVSFLTVSHGFSAHVGFMRTFSAEAGRYLDKGRGADGWSYSEKLADNWYLVGD